MTDKSPTSGFETPGDSPLDPGLFTEHAHHRRVEERISRLERRGEILMLLVIFVLGAAMAVGLLAANGAVTW